MGRGLQMLDRLSSGVGYNIRTIRIRDKKSIMFHKVLEEVSNLRGSIACYRRGNYKVIYLREKEVRVVYTIYSGLSGEVLEVIKHRISVNKV